MSNAVKLFIGGVLPLVAGYVLNFLICFLPLPGIFLILINIVLVFLWGYLSYRLSAPNINTVVQAMLMCTFGLLMLALALYQELALGQYWFNFVGFGTQMYFLPFLSITSIVFSPLISVFMPVMRPWPLFICELLCMIGVSGIGCYIKKRR